MARAEKPAAAKTGSEASEGEDAPAPDGRLRWFIGWVVAPGLVLAAIFGAGVHLGASRPDAWYTSLVLWIVGLFG